MKKGNGWQGITWKSKTMYVDTETGEILLKERVSKYYVIINKQVKTNVTRTTGTKEYTYECRRSQQLRLDI